MEYPPTQGTSPPNTEQHSEHLLRGGQCACCVHTGGLSCSFFYRRAGVAHTVSPRGCGTPKSWVRIPSILVSKCEYVDNKGLALLLATKRPAGVTPERNLRDYPGFETHGRCHQKSKPGYQWPHKKDLRIKI